MKSVLMFVNYVKSGIIYNSDMWCVMALTVACGLAMLCISSMVEVLKYLRGRNDSG